MTKTTTKTEPRTPICYGRVCSRANHAQEWYETASRDAGQRAKELRAQGFRVYVSGMGPQVTGVGVVKMTLVTVDGDREVPAPARLERM